MSVGMLAPFEELLEQDDWPSRYRQRYLPASADVQLGWPGNALALHQYHAVFKPPLDKFYDVVRNASYFHQRWENWCLEYWLEQFAELGYIRWQDDGSSIEVIAVPSKIEIEETRQPPEVAFS